MPNAMTTILAVAVLTAASVASLDARPFDRGAQERPLVNAPADPGHEICGTVRHGVLDLLARHAERPAAPRLATTFSRDAGEIAVLEDDGTFFYTYPGGYPKVDHMSVARAFYATHGDDYDFLAVFLSTGLDDYLGSPTAFAAAFVVRNQIQGIGLDTFDFAAEFGSPARLQTVLAMNGLHRYPDDPLEDIEDSAAMNSYDALGHEMAHRWMSYVYVDSLGQPVPALLGRARQHWGFFFDAGPSIMEGCDWSAVGPDSFRTVAVSEGYGPLDLYLMGMRTKAETPPFYVVNDPHDLNPPGTYVPTSIPVVGVSCDGRATTWTVNDIEAVHGPRIPDPAVAPRSFRIGVILLTANGQDATPGDLAKLEALRSGFVPWFASRTEGRGSVDMSITSRAGDVVIAHSPLLDAETASSRPVGARVTIDQAGIPLAVDPGSVRVFWRNGTSGPFTSIMMSPAGPDSFAATLPAATGLQQYYLYASSDSTGIDAFDPPGGAAAPHTFTVGPDATPPTIVHVPIPLQGPERFPLPLLARITDNVGLDSTWLEYRTNGGATQTLALTPAGRDSFRATLPYAPIGWVIAYRFVARDAATAHNVAYSRAAFDTLVVTRDLYDDFENGSFGFMTGFSTNTYRWLWHASQEASQPPGGTSMKSGSEDGTPYPPHIDSGLLCPGLASARILPGAQLVFDHRYDLEQANATRAWDGARVEGRLESGPWIVLQPVGGYTHTAISGPLGAGTPCWSGNSGGWRTATVDLSPLAGGNWAVVRFRMTADEFVSGEGWFVDRLRWVLPDGTTEVPFEPTVELSAPWPNPARDVLRLSAGLAGAGGGDAEWSLYDLAGRRVATLWKGRLAPGGADLSASLPSDLRSGVYFSRLDSGGRTLSTHRVAVVR